MHLLTDEQREKLSNLSLKERQKEILKEEYRNGEWYAKDIREVTGESIPKCDIWCFGAPCQDFSIAGARHGLDGDRSSLVREVFRILGEQEEGDRPEWLVYENVKGMLSSNRGWDYLSILLQVEELGYDCQWNLFNSKYHGVPQNRERVYLIGHLRCRGRSKVLSFGRANEENSLEEINPECVGGFGEKASNGGTQFYQQDRVYDGEKVATTLSHQLPVGGGGLEPCTIEKVNVKTSNETSSSEINQIGRLGDANRDNPNRFRVYDPNGIGASLDAGVGGGRGEHTIVPIEMDPTTSSDETNELDQIKIAKYPFGNQKSDIFSTDGVLRTLAATDYKQPISIGVPFGIDKGVEGEEREIANALTARENRGISNHKQEGTAVATPFMYDDYNSKFRDDHVSGTITPNTGSKTERTGQKVCIPVLTPDRLEKRQNGRRMKEDGDPSFTLTAQDKHGVAIGIETSQNIEIEGNYMPSGHEAGNIMNTNGIAVDVSSNPNVLGNAYPSGGENGNIYDENSVSSTLKAGEGIIGNGVGSCNAPKVALNTKSIGVDLKGGYPGSTRGGVIKEETVGALDHNCYVGVGQPIKSIIDNKQSISINIKEAITKGYAEACEDDSITPEMLDSNTHRGRVDHQVAQTLTTSCNKATIVAIDADEPDKEHPGLYIQLTEDCLVYAVWYEKYQCYIAIRKLTPKECFRLQGWSDGYFERAQFVNTDSQLYKQAGNGVTVNVVYVVGQKINSAMGIK